MPQAHATLTATECLRRLIEAETVKSGPNAWIDVRSESEFLAGSLPGFVNAPILRDQERHWVGTAYKTEGQARAIELGHELVKGDRESRMERWKKIAKAGNTDEPIMTCWRGGLRSKIACEWAREMNLRPVQLLGGFKAVRRLLFKDVSEGTFNLLVLSGRTGSRKTVLLNDLSESVKCIDLEALAAHRGSAFGKDFFKDQPSQVTFENALSVKLMAERSRNDFPILVEDESSAIGAIRLPARFRRQMAEAPVIRLESSVADRAKAIELDYIHGPIERGKPREWVHDQFRERLKQIRRRLGDECYREIDRSLLAATEGKEPHSQWIEKLLRTYYDPMYDYALQRWSRREVFHGDYESCKNYLNRAYASRRP